VLGEALGTGAMGRVYSATVRETGRPVAIKILREDLSSDSELVARFVQERRALGAVRHPNVVSVHDLVVEGDRLGIVMDLVPGGDLRHAVRFPVGVGEALEMVGQIAAGLEAVHSADVIHRDLKPENILVDTTAGQRQLRVTDFGVSRLVGQTLTRVTSLLGTPGYLAPEVTSGGRPTAKVDMYAIGAILFEMLTGRAPFAADNVMALLRAHAENPVPRPAGMPDELWAFVSSLLAKDPDGRPTAAEAAASAAMLRSRFGELGPFTELLPASPSAPLPPPSAFQPTLTPEPTIISAPTVARASRQAAEETVKVREPASTTATVARPTRRRRRGALIALTAIVLLVAAGGVVWVTRGDEPTTAASPVQYSSAPVQLSNGLLVKRTWEVTNPDGWLLTSTLEVKNTTEEVITADLEEVIPKGIAD
jgi:serine/threonine-protein kinase